VKEYEEEIFRLLGYSWNIAAIKKYIDENKDKVPVGLVNPKDFSKLIGFIHVDKEYAMKSTNNEPIIVAEYKKGEHIAIDGWHRIYRDIENGCDSISYYLLDFETQNQFR
jgi:hypothetical protein